MTEQLLIIDEYTDDSDDLTFIDDRDPNDDGELRKLITLTEKYMNLPHQAQASCLNSEQWDTAINRSMNARIRRSLAPYLHVLPDPADPRHLFISPSAVAGINEQQGLLIAEVVYAVIFATGPKLPPVYARGGADIVAGLVSARTHPSFFTRNYPEEASFVLLLINVLQKELGYSLAEWIGQLESRPEVFFRALRRSAFTTKLLCAARNNQEVAPLLESARNKRTRIIELLYADDFSLRDPLAKVVIRTAHDYLAEGGAENDHA